jgi:hypothetical protein
MIALSMIVVAGNYNASQSSASSVKTCYNKKTGDLRYSSKTCKSTERSLSIGKIGPQGATGKTGARGDVGPSGPIGATGPAGYSAGFSAADIFSDLGIYDPTVELSSAESRWVFNTDDISDYGASNGSSLTVAGTKPVQVSVNLQLGAPDVDANDPEINEVGNVVCNLFQGESGSALSTFLYIPGSETVLAVSDIVIPGTPNYYLDARGTMTLQGFTDLTGSKAFAAKCLIMPYPGQPVPDIRVLNYTLNAIAIG